jgi:quinohemoprotein ethanol dehydrogenase
MMNVSSGGWTRLSYFAWVMISGFMLAACSPSEPEVSAGTVVDDASLADDSNGDNWLAYGRTYSEQRFSPLDQINASNIVNLKVDWYLDLPRARGLVSTPLVVDGTLYFIGDMNRMRAVDARNGTLLWEFDPQTAENSGNTLRAGWEHNRGIGIWKDKVYVATWDGRLVAINRNDGSEVWSVRTFDPELPLYITGAPKIFKGKVLIGNGGTENGPTRGYVTAYDAETGERAWRFYIVPGNPADGFENDAMRMAAETWTGEWWKIGGGGNAWNGFTYDAEFDTLYIGTGNGSPWNRKLRSPGGGDNLFLCSIVALDPDTGEYKWHYQTTPGETWDYNSNMDIVLADLEIADRTIKALMHAPKNGFFYVIDRETGRLISAEAFTETTWATHIDLETGRPVEVVGARYEDGSQIISPTPWGAHSWHAMSYNPGTGLVYIPAMHLSAEFNDETIEHDSWKPASFFEGGDAIGVGFTLMESDRDVTSTLQAWDPVRGEVAWEIPLTGKWNAGTLTTAGNLVLQGRVTGDLVAYDAASGEQLWSFATGLGISAPPISYAVDGKQYVSILVGWGGGMSGIGGTVETQHGWAYGVHTRRLITFSLDGSADLPPQPPPTVPEPLVLPDFEIDLALANRGESEFSRCFYCHGPGAVSTGMAPDLRASPVVASADSFNAIVRDGSRVQNAMPAFPHLTDTELDAIRNYIRLQAESAAD